MNAHAARVAAVIPAFNEVRTVATIVHRTAPHVRWVIVVDDGSTDGTAAALAGLPVRVLANGRNLGKGASLLRGFEHALALGADAVVTLDADGQHLPEDIPRLLAASAHRPGDIVIGARLHHRERMPRLRRFGNAMADFWISWACGYPVRDTQSGMRLYPGAALARVCPRRARGFVLESELLIEAARTGCYASCIGIDTIYGSAPRRSHYRTMHDTLAIVAMVAAKLARRGLYPLGLLRSLGLLAHPRAGSGDRVTMPG
ncbi:MAG: glycosyltransferase family 2 protein [Gammaproteobacteria bacterium]|nr:glycosyltransferase family 2 protein [Gammaproteobacteria bacterium]